MTQKIAYPSIPRLAGQKGDIVALTQLAEILTGARGDGLDRALTPRDLIDLGILDYDFRAYGTGKQLQITTGDAVDSVGYNPVIESPTTPVNVTAGGSHIHAFISWDAPTFGGFSHAEIWRSNVDDYGTAVRIGTTQGTIYSDAVGVGKEYYYWVRFVNISDEVGPIHNTAGAFAQTSQDISAIMTDLSEQLTNGDLNLDASTFAVKPSGGSTTYPFIVVDNVVYMVSAMIQSASIVNAQIFDLNVDKITGDIANFVIANIGLGTITNAMIGNVIQSTNWDAANHIGWKLDKAGNAEFNKISIYDESTGSLIFQTGVGVQTPGFDWDYILGPSKPADNADVTANSPQGADWLTNAIVGDHNPIDLANISTFIASAAIGSAYIRNAAIGQAHIQNLAVSTLKIQDDAVTVPASAFTAAEIIVATGTIVQSVALNSLGQPVNLQATISFRYKYLSSLSSISFLDIHLYEGGSLLRTWRTSLAFSLNYIYDTVTITYKHTPTTGPKTYHVKISRGSVTMYASNRSLFVLGLKK